MKNKFNEDYLVVSTTPENSALHDNSEPIFRGMIDLTDDLHFGDFDHDTAKEILDACEPMGKNFNPTRQYGIRYLFKRKRLFQEDEFSWDPGSLIRKTLALSRLIHPTPIGYLPL